MYSIYRTCFKGYDIAFKYEKSKTKSIFHTKTPKFARPQGFPENWFLSKNLQNRPLFSVVVRSIRLKFLLQVLETLWGAYFFHFKNDCTAEFWRIFQEQYYPKKPQFFGVLLVF